MKVPNKTYIPRLLSLSVILFLLLVPLSQLVKSETTLAAGTTYYVSQSATNGYQIGNGANDGLAKATPKLTITGAQTAASSGDTVIVNDGTYASMTFTKGLTITPENVDAVSITKATAGGQVIYVNDRCIASSSSHCLYSRYNLTYWNYTFVWHNK